SAGWSNLFILLGLLMILNVFALSPASKWFQEKFLPILEGWYERFLKFSLFKRRPVGFFLGMIGLFILSIVLVGLFTPKVLFFPENQPNYVNVFIEHPIGTDIKVTNQTTLEVERILNEELIKTEIEDTLGKEYEE